MEIFKIVQDIGLPTVLCLLVFYQFIKITNKIVESVEGNMQKIADELRQSYKKKSLHLDRLYAEIRDMHASLNYIAGRLDAHLPAKIHLEKEHDEELSD